MDWRGEARMRPRLTAAGATVMTLGRATPESGHASLGPSDIDNLII